ncbi:MAG: hypothetical protein ACYSSI_00165 [Planctomycetota bacterium]
MKDKKHEIVDFRREHYYLDANELEQISDGETVSILTNDNRQITLSLWQGSEALKAITAK